jgi:hypothetical protein
VPRRYETGKYLQKKNTFTDFVACAELLVERRFTSPGRLCIEGRSAGGLTMGAVINLRPDLFHAAILGVPFVDVLTTMLDDTIPLTSELPPSSPTARLARQCQLAQGAAAPARLASWHTRRGRAPARLPCRRPHDLAPRLRHVQRLRPRNGGIPRRRSTTTT